MKAQTTGLKEELFKLKNQNPTPGEPANSLVTGTLCFPIFMGLMRMEALVTGFVVVSDIATGLILLSCSHPLSPTLSKVGTDTYIKQWEQ